MLSLDFIRLPHAPDKKEYDLDDVFFAGIPRENEHLLTKNEINALLENKEKLANRMVDTLEYIKKQEQENTIIVSGILAQYKMIEHYMSFLDRKAIPILQALYELDNDPEGQELIDFLDKHPKLSRILTKLSYDEHSYPVRDMDITKMMRSFKLVKDWLTKDELEQLVHNRRVEIPNREDGTEVFLVSADPQEVIQVAEADTKTIKARYCRVIDRRSIEVELPELDYVLTKIMLAKTRPDMVKRIQDFEQPIQYDHRPPREAGTLFPDTWAVTSGTNTGTYTFRFAIPYDAPVPQVDLGQIPRGTSVMFDRERGEQLRQEHEEQARNDLVNEVEQVMTDLAPEPIPVAPRVPDDVISEENVFNRARISAEQILQSYREEESIATVIPRPTMANIVPNSIYTEGNEGDNNESS